MAVSRHQLVAEKLISAFEKLATEGPQSPGTSFGISAPSSLSGPEAMEIFESQLASRLIDLEARALKAREAGFYTIGSAGHESNACIAAALRPTDMCFLHYRSGAFMMQRSKQVPGSTPIFDTLLSLSASSEDPASGGRHKVWGSKKLAVPPQTSTIGSHVPKALGAAFALGRWPAISRHHPMPHAPEIPLDSVIMASFGDASLNHSTTVGAINAALWAAHQKMPLPLLLVCEDNSIGISVRTPEGWIASQYQNRSGLGYFTADGGDLAASYETALRAAEYVRKNRAPAMLHLKTVRLMGHAGSDVEQNYRTKEEIEKVESSDPLIRIANWLVWQGFCTGADLLELHSELEDRIEAASNEASSRRKIKDAKEVKATLTPFDATAFQEEVTRIPQRERRIEAFGGEAKLPEARPRRRHMAMLLNWALHDLMVKYPEMLVFGEDVSKKGGVYHVTNDLVHHFGVGRVFNTLLDEQTILGLAIGAAQIGYLPCPEIQYLAYLVHAVDQIRGEACSLQFFSNNTYQNPMVIRVAGLGYQRGFGGHFHNDNGFGFLRDTPGLVLACPTRGDDAVCMLRSSFALSRSSGRVVVFMEPIALYMTKDLYEDGDEGWSFPYPALEEHTPLGEARIYAAEGGPEELVIITYGNGVRMSLRAAKKEGVRCRVIDLRWLMPLNRDAITEAAEQCSRVLVVDEGRETAGIGEQIISCICETSPTTTTQRVTGDDCYIPLAGAAHMVMVSEADIRSGIRALLEKK